MVTLLVAVAAGIGAVLRYLVDREVSHRVRSERPYGTFAVNLSGSLLLGLVVGLTLHHGLGGRPGAVLGAGLLGGYTTLSTWAYESLVLAEIRDVRGAVANVAGSLVLGLGAAAAGLALALV